MSRAEPSLGRRSPPTRFHRQGSNHRLGLRLWPDGAWLTIGLLARVDAYMWTIARRLALMFVVADAIAYRFRYALYVNWSTANRNKDIDNRDSG